MWPGWAGARIATPVPVLCCSSHFLPLLPWYLPFLVSLLIRQLVDRLVNVCTTLSTSIVLICCSLLLLLCFCRFPCFPDVAAHLLSFPFPSYSCLSWRSRTGLFLLFFPLRTVLWCHRIPVTSYSVPHPYFSSSYFSSHYSEAPAFSCPDFILLAACKSELRAVLPWNSRCVS